MAQRSQRPPAVRSDGTRKRERHTRGEVLIEYVLVMAFFALPVAAATWRLGFPLLRFFRYAQLALVGPFP